MPTPTRRAIRRSLEAVHLPVSLYLGVIGVAALAGPGVINGAVTAWLAYAWSVALIVGTLLIVSGVCSEKSRAESVGHMFHLFALSLLAAVNLTEVGGSDVIALATLAGVSLLRMRQLRRSRLAQREAARLLNGECP